MKYLILNEAVDEKTTFFNKFAEVATKIFTGGVFDVIASDEEESAPTSHAPKAERNKWWEGHKAQIIKAAKSAGIPVDDLFWAALAMNCEDLNFNAYADIQEGKYKGKGHMDFLEDKVGKFEWEQVDAALKRAGWNRAKFE